MLWVVPQLYGEPVAQGEVFFIIVQTVYHFYVDPVCKFIHLQSIPVHAEEQQPHSLMLPPSLGWYVPSHI